MNKNNIPYYKEIVNTVLPIFQFFLISQLVYNNNTFAQSKLIEQL